MGNYTALNSQELEYRIKSLLDVWNAFLENSIKGYDNKKIKVSEQTDLTNVYSVNYLALREVFERTHQREDYFIRYHQNLKMSNYKEIGLIAFWITKLKPFRLKEEFFEDYYDFRINEEFSLYFIFNSISRIAKEKEQEYELTYIGSELYNELLYTIQYRDLSKEAYGCLVELISIATSK